MASMSMRKQSIDKNLLDGNDTLRRLRKSEQAHTEESALQLGYLDVIAQDEDETVETEFKSAVKPTERPYLQPVLPAVNPVYADAGYSDTTASVRNAADKGRTYLEPVVSPHAGVYDQPSLAFSDPKSLGNRTYLEPRPLTLNSKQTSEYHDALLPRTADATAYATVPEAQITSPYARLGADHTPYQTNSAVASEMQELRQQQGYNLSSADKKEQTKRQHRIDLGAINPQYEEARTLLSGSSFQVDGNGTEGQVPRAKEENTPYAELGGDHVPYQTASDISSEMKQLLQRQGYMPADSDDDETAENGYDYARLTHAGREDGVYQEHETGPVYAEAETQSTFYAEVGAGRGSQNPTYDRPFL
eukprot:m.222499 g.222499  ORF g.222499 m.222499 type:complete len:361 (+) comp17021_c2_seq1:608-1690(+)